MDQLERKHSNIAANYVTAIDFDANNNIYVSAHNTFTWPYYGGFSYFDGTGTTFTTFLDGSSPLAHKQVEDIAVDSFGNIWILTQSEGLVFITPTALMVLIALTEPWKEPSEWAM